MGHPWHRPRSLRRIQALDPAEWRLLFSAPMPADARVLDLTVRGVALTEETLHYVRRCRSRMVERVGIRDRPIQVLLERARLSEETHAYVALADGASALRGRGRDLDVLLAVREAFDRLTVRLLELHPGHREPLTTIDETIGWFRLAARHARRAQSG